MNSKLLLFLALVAFLCPVQAATKPNVVFILADDLGIGNVGCYGADNYKTPHIDRLASEGTRFTQCFTAALCGPSRAMIMTGRYAFRTGSSNQDACMVMPNKELQLGRVFKSAGYKTASIGKWGQLPGDPDESGFDDYLRFNGSGVYRNKKEGKAEEYLVNGKELKLGDDEYMPDLMHEHMMKFIKKHKDQPFFVYYPMSSVHGDLLPTPDSASGSTDLMADNIAYMDKLVGRLLADLEALKLRDNTLIIFMGDNGTGKGQSERATIGGKALSGMKGTMLECGGLVPMIASWPGKTPAGNVSADLIDSTDFLATFAELTGGALPKDTIFDGHSIAPQLRGEPGTPREWVYNQLAAMWYVRDAKWKLNEKGELYDMSDAPFTEKFVTGDHPARTKLAAVLAKLNPAGGIPDSGDGTGRHAHKDKDKKKKTDSHSTAAPKPNILFIAVDDMRPELGCYGNKVIKTPNIDRIAARGIVFNKAYCQQAVCSPSRTAIMTGLRPDVTKVWDLETHFRVAQPDCITLPQHFKVNGYHCAALSKVYHAGFEDGRSWNEPHWYPKGRAVDTDPVDWTKQIVTRHEVNTEEYSAPQEGGPARKNGKGAKKGPAYEVSPKQDDELPDGATAAEAVRRLAALKTKGEPFFLAVGFLKPHLPFVAPKKYWDLYDPNAIPVPTTDKLPTGSPDFAGHTNSELHGYPGVPQGNPIPDDFAKTLRHGYYACISYTDAQIGKVLDALDKEGLADNTIIVLWGDHGWQLGDHGLWHKHTNFEIATRAPLLISVPGSKTAGQKCDAPVEFVDVYPTLADVCGLPVPSGLGGSSLKGFIEDPRAPATDVAMSQYPRSAPEGPVMGYSIRNERYRATFWRERNGAKIIATELYDEEKDPTETVSLAEKPEHKELLETLLKHLPPVGSDVSSGTKSRGKGKAAAEPKPSSADEPRDVRYDRLYPGMARISMDEYLAKQSNGDEAKTRFAKFDRDKDGFVSREEFIKGRK